MFVVGPEIARNRRVLSDLSQHKCVSNWVNKSWLVCVRVVGIKMAFNYEMDAPTFTLFMQSHGMPSMCAYIYAYKGPVVRTGITAVNVRLIKIRLFTFTAHYTLWHGMQNKLNINDILQ